jgi:nucleotide-binding universal stress UspA family protein
MYERILVPTDGSPGGGDAVEEALDIAELSGGTVHALFVVDTRDYSTLPEAKWLTLESELEGRGEQAVAAVADRAEEREVPVETAIERGVPHERILEYADEQDVDVVVMGTHGRSGLDRFLIGSVTEKVVRSADVPVLTVRIAAE